MNNGVTAALVRDLKAVDVAAQSVVSQVKLKIAAGEQDEAKEILTASIERDGPNGLLLEQLGLLFYLEGDYESAIANLRPAVNLDASLVKAQLALLRSANHSADRGVSVALAEDVMAKGPDDPQVLVAAAKAYRRGREFKRSGDVWLRIASKQPTDGSAAAEAADAFFRAKDFASALDCAVMAIDRNPALEAAQTLRLLALEKLKATPDAIGAAVQGLATVNATAAIEYLPVLLSAGLHAIVADLLVRCKHQNAQVDPVLMSSLSKTLHRAALGAERDAEFEASARFWHCLVVINPDDKAAASGFAKAVSALLREGRALAHGGDFARASEMFRALIAVDPAQASARRNLGSSLEKCDQHREAAEVWLECASDPEADDRTASALRGAKAARKLESPGEQLSFLKRARDIAPDDADIAKWGDFALSKSVRAIGDAVEAADYVGAAEQIELAREWDAAAPRLLTVIRRFVREVKIEMQEADRNGEGSDAARLAELLLRVDPTRISAWKLVGRHALQERRYSKAVEIYKRLIEIEPHEERHYSKLGRSFKALRLYDEGIPVVMRLLDLHPDHPQGRQLLSELLHGRDLQNA